MLSRGSALAIANTYGEVFRIRDRLMFAANQTARNSLHDFLFEREYPLWVCEEANKLYKVRNVQEWIMRLHTGQSVCSQEAGDPVRVGRQLLHKLAEDILNFFWQDPRVQNPQASDERYYRHQFEPLFGSLQRRLKFDGYEYENGRLRAPESDVLDTKESAGVLEALYTNLRLAEREVALHCLKTSEEQWVNGKWDDCISEARRFLECVLKEIAIAHCSVVDKAVLPDSVTKRPVEVRKYLEQKKLFNADEMKTFASSYGLMSSTGSHPTLRKTTRLAYRDRSL